MSVEVWPWPQWRFVVGDDGCGFDPSLQPDETHVGQRIMAERARQIGARLEVLSRPGCGTQVVLELPATPAGAASNATGAGGQNAAAAAPVRPDAVIPA